MSRNTGGHFLPGDKLAKIIKRKIDPETVRAIQSFSEKVISDIINRSALLASHIDTDVIDAHEISNVIEKNFDYSFGIRAVNGEKKLPNDDHLERMAELSKNK